jgi:hypothetical protein|tara:strand:- start:803 stop:1078 length:276 start_codon:yes stop_codon:yes gene_type:complete
MAKRKTPKVKDLKPQINTIEKNELTDLQKVVGTLDMRYAQLGKIESEKHQILHIVAGHRDELQLLQSKFEDKYGDNVDIDIRTGEIKERNG